jgi:hypothetical protein
MADYDGAWKEALDAYFEAFLAFFFPLVYADIDWSRGWESLDAELQKLTPDAAHGRRYADKLVRVWLRDGSETWLLIHVEVQSQYEADFGRRVYVYNYRIFDSYNADVVSLVVLADDRAGWRPRGFHHGRWGSRAGIDFEPAKLLDYAKREAELEASSNPFATVTLAHLKAMETHGDPSGRQLWKIRLVRNLYERGFAAADVRRLFQCIDMMMELPPALANTFWQTIDRFEQERRMPYITSVERIGMTKGERKGLLRGIQTFLEFRFGASGTALLPEIQAIEDLETLGAVLEASKTVSTPEELRALCRPSAPNAPGAK